MALTELLYLNSINLPVIIFNILLCLPPGPFGINYITNGNKRRCRLIRDTLIK
jgi:hypothetical protein